MIEVPDFSWKDKTPVKRNWIFDTKSGKLRSVPIESHRVPKDQGENVF